MRVSEKKFSMQSLQKNTLVYGIGFVAAVILLSSLSFWRVVSFDFWRDDWRMLCSIQNPTLVATLFQKIELHGGTWVENALLFPLFGWKSAFWHLFGIGLRVLASLSVALMIWSLTREKRIAALAGLFFAASFAGLESVGWVAVHVTTVVIIFSCTGFYFWCTYLRDRKIKNFVFGLLLLECAALSSSARSLLSLLLLLPLWEFFLWWASPKKEGPQYIFARLAIVYALLIPSALIISSHLHDLWGHNTNIAWYVERLLQEPHLLKNYFATIGNLLFGWILPIEESMGAANYSSVIANSAMFLMISGSAVGLYVGLQKKSKKAFLFVFFIAWILISYIPGYLFVPQVFAGSHRYVALSAVGLIGIAALGIGSLKNNTVRFVAAAVFIVLNVVTSNRILKKESAHRSFRIVEPILDRIAADFPRNERGGIVMLLGNADLEYSILEMPGPAVYDAKTRACKNNYSFFPSTDNGLIIELLCGHTPPARGFGSLPLPPSPVPLSKIYAWEMSGGSINNVSERERERLRAEAAAQGCTVKET